MPDLSYSSYPDLNLVSSAPSNVAPLAWPNPNLVDKLNMDYELLHAIDDVEYHGYHENIVLPAVMVYKLVYGQWVGQGTSYSTKTGRFYNFSGASFAVESDLNGGCITTPTTAGSIGELEVYRDNIIVFTELSTCGGKYALLFQDTNSHALIWKSLQRAQKSVTSKDDHLVLLGDSSSGNATSLPDIDWLMLGEATTTTTQRPGLQTPSYNEITSMQAPSMLTIQNTSPLEELETIQHWLDDHIYHPNRKAQIYRLLDCASQNEGILPPSLLISGVQMLNADVPFAGGSFADVFRGLYRGQDVAVKRFRVFLSPDGKTKLYKRFCREALLWRQLKHPRILPFLGIDHDAFNKGVLKMVSSWMSRGTLMEYLENKGSGDIAHVLLITGIASGLKYLHDQAFAHGDLHGSNIFIDQYSRPVLADFGLTAFADAAHLAATTTINKAGAIRWLAPELVHQDDGPPPRKTTSGDIFAFGRLCLSIFTRLVPYHTVRSDTVVLFRVLQNHHPERPSIEECYGCVMSDALWGLIESCWMPDHKARPNIKVVILTLTRAL